MSLFSLRWLHRIIRRKTKPLPVETAHAWKQHLSVAYMILAWNIFGAVAYMCYTDRSDWAKYYGLKTEEELEKKPGVYYAELLGLKNGHVISLSGLTKKEEYDYIATQKTDN